jgi:hypothetical protein
MSDNTNKHKEEEYRQEDLMASGPVSRGAENKTAPMYNQQQGTPQNQKNSQDTGDYNKMIQSESSGPTEGTGMANDQKLATPGGGTLPGGGTSSDSPRGGINTSNSTVSGGSSSGGTVVGQGASVDRGRMTDPQMDMTTNTENELDINSRPGKQKQNVKGQVEPPVTPNNP